MIVQVLPDQMTPQIWEIVKYGVYTIEPPKDVERFFNAMLQAILCSEEQVWFCLDDEANVKVMWLTRLQRDVDLFGRTILQIKSVFGFTPASNEDKSDFNNKVVECARNLGCQEVYTYTANPVAKNAAIKSGFKHTHDLFIMKVEEEGVHA